MHKGKGKRSKFYLICTIIVLGLLFIVCPKNAFASDDHIVINEIFPAPDTGKEWVELYNPTQNDIDLSGYYLKDGAVAAKNISGIIEANNYFVFEYSSGWLNNSSEIIFLLEKSTDNIIDKVAYGDWDTKVLDKNTDTDPDDNAIAPKSEKSISRIPNGYDSDNDKQNFRIVATSPGIENIALNYVDCLKINEIYPQPLDGSQLEFIELSNTCGTDIDISGWQIDDDANGSSPYIIPDGMSIVPGAYLSFYNLETKISLNDNGDSARLIDPNGDIKDTVNYEKSSRGMAYAKFAEGYLWSNIATPNMQNIFGKELNSEIETENQNVDIKKAKTMETGSTVTVSGAVTVLPGTLSDQYFYIQDEISGIQIYSYKGLFPSLKIGDSIKVKGDLANTNGEMRLKIIAESDIEIISSGEIPKIKELQIDHISEEDTGMLISAIGEVSETSGDVFAIADNNKQIKVMIRESANIEKPKMRKGNKVKATGILSVYKGELRILPINQDGVIILSAGVLPITGYEIEDGFMRYNSLNLADTEVFAKKIAKSLKGGDILLLKGDLGSGKTTLTQMVLNEFGVTENVTSPTFVIMKNYLIRKEQNRISEVAHVDAYRLAEGLNIDEIGLQEYIKRDDVLVIIEWPEKINNSLPIDSKMIEISTDNQNSRLFVTNWEL